MLEAAELELKNKHPAFSLLPQGLCFGFSHLCFLSPSFPTFPKEEKILAALGDRGDDGTWGESQGSGFLPGEM